MKPWIDLRSAINDGIKSRNRLRWRKLNFAYTIEKDHMQIDWKQGFPISYADRGYILRDAHFNGILRIHKGKIILRASVFYSPGLCNGRDCKLYLLVEILIVFA